MNVYFVYLLFMCETSHIGRLCLTAEKLRKKWILAMEEVDQVMNRPQTLKGARSHAVDIQHNKYSSLKRKIKTQHTCFSLGRFIYLFLIVFQTKKSKFR